MRRNIFTKILFQSFESTCSTFVGVLIFLYPLQGLSSYLSSVQICLVGKLSTVLSSGEVEEKLAGVVAFWVFVDLFYFGCSADIGNFH